jgi:glycine/D-amino acid oxidase-like deaminating enzyme
VIGAPLWTAPLATSPVELVPVPDRSDVAVVGAGYTGLSAAIALSRRGVKTTVLEAQRVGSGASSLNGGMVLTGLKLGPEALLRRYGERSARALFEASTSAIDALERLLATEEIDCSYFRTGHLELACTPRHFERFSLTQNVLSRVFGHPVRVLSRSELASEIGSTAFAGGLLDERSGGLDPYRYVLGLADAAWRAGAIIAEQARVFRIEPHRDGWRLRTSRGDLACDHVLVATGAYTGREFPHLRRRLVPLGSYVIATEPLPADLARELVPRNRMLFDSKRLLHYFRLTPDSRMLFGGRAAFVPANRETTRRSARLLRRDMIATFPQLRDANVEFAWGGTLDLTFDLMPHAGQIDGFYYATGYAGHGVALSTLLGTLIAQAMVDKRAPAPFDRALPGAPFPLYDGQPWFLPLLGAWAHIADRVS